MKRLRIFISSPGDVVHEREIARNVVDQVGRHFSGRIQLDCYFWEHEPMIATADYQTNLPSPAQFDIVVAILWSRLGASPRNLPKRGDDTSYGSVTEFEIESAIGSFRERGSPQLLVYRRIGDPVIPAEPRQEREERIAQYDALTRFIERLSKDPDGTFSVALLNYGSPEEFEIRFEEHLRRLVEDRIAESDERHELPSSVKHTSTKTTNVRTSKIMPVSGSARTRTPEEAALDLRSENERHLRSGDATLADLFGSALGRGMEEADDHAFRVGAALATRRKQPFDSSAVLMGYLLTAPLPGTKSETAITKIIWHQCVQAQKVEAEMDRVDFWNMLGLSAFRGEIESLASIPDGTDGIKISSNLGEMLLRSVKVAREAGRPRLFSTRHLLVCLLGESGQRIDDSALGLLRLLNVNLRRVRRMLRDWLGTKRSRDKADILDAELGVTAEASHGAWLPEWEPLRDEMAKVSESAPQDDPLLPVGGNVLISAPDVDKPQVTLQGQDATSRAKRVLGITGFSSEHATLGARSGVTDELDINNFVTLFAELIAARETVLPLSMGLFAEWGAGKSHFMRMLEQKIDDLANETKVDWAKRIDQEAAPSDENREGPWCQRVIPIRFNAWHYRDTDLWASLVTEIFDRMFEFLAGPQKGAEDRLKAAEKLMKQVKKARGVVAEAAAEAKAAEEAAQRAKIEARKETNRIEQLVRERERQQAVIAGMLDNFELLLPEGVRKAEWEDALRILRLKKKESSGCAKKLAQTANGRSLHELEERVSQFQSLSGRARALWFSVAAEDGRASRLLYLAGAVIAAPILAGFVMASLTFWNQGIQQTGMLIGSVVGFIGSTSAWLGKQMHRADKILTSAETMMDAAQARRVDLERTPEMRRLRAEVAKLDKKEEEAVERLRDAKAKVQRLEEEMRELRPERRLFRFIEERAAAKDYRQHLGLISLVRRDFQELSRLFTEKKDGATVWESLLGNVERSIDRIVLYVDDLDRCQPQRVVEVLEAVHLLLDFPLFVAVVAVDPRWVKQCLRAHYSKLLSGAQAAPSGPQQSSLNDEEEHASPLDYLEKIFHIPFHLPMMKVGGFKKLIIKLAGQTETTETQSGQTAADADSETMLLGVQEHERSSVEPRVPEADETERNLGVVASQTHESKSAIDERNLPPTSGETKVLGIVKLETWEVERLNEYASLVSTPRAAKRFLNTYRLVRAGLPTADWGTFCGDTDKSGEFRVTMLLLAAAAGSPALAREWFKTLRTAHSTALFLSDDDEQSRRPEWKQFKRVYDATFTETTLDLSKELFANWLDRVERFAF